MQRIRFIMVGGFLGAGKTTTLARLARHYMSQGRRVGLVTNDQAQDLVDTGKLRAEGFPVEEVAGACFCCRFDDLVHKIGRLNSDQEPHVILAEPVGSCTDLVATVIQPFKDLYGDNFTVAPYAAIFKPSHGLRILRNEAGGGFSPKAAYIFHKQLEEADAVLLNRIDELPPAELAELTELVGRRYPNTPLFPVSAKTGAGFPAVVEFLEQEGDFGRKVLDIDYDVYAEGEAELGWLNSTVQITAPQPFALDDLMLEVVTRLRDALAAAGAEVAHLKAIGLWDGGFGTVNLVSSRSEPELPLPSRGEVREVDLVVNARVAVDPAVLERDVRQAVTEACAARGAAPVFRQVQSFRPGRPQPSHRYATVR
jgi:Ni2+-binding GTPase involved in maturation of urease and hydrogenase